MKQLVATAVLTLAPSMVLAQNVQIYGIVDAGVSRTTGKLGGNRNSVISGLMEGSR